MVALSVVFAKRRIDDAGTVQDAHDVDPVTDRQVGGEIPDERETPDPGGESVAGAPHAPGGSTHRLSACNGPAPRRQALRRWIFTTMFDAWRPPDPPGLAVMTWQAPALEPTREASR